MTLIRSKIEVTADFCDDVEILLRLSPDDCEPKPEKALSPPASPLVELCRITARANYLLALLACSGDQACCDAAYEAYCEALKACG